MAIIGLDVGGANLKAAHAGGAARTVPLALRLERLGGEPLLPALVRALRMVA